MTGSQLAEVAAKPEWMFARAEALRVEVAQFNRCAEEIERTIELFRDRKEPFAALLHAQEVCSTEATNIMKEIEKLT